MKTESNTRIGLLVSIDDTVFDQMMNERIVKRSGLVNDFRTFLDPLEALEFLRLPDRPPVDAILLDINMPKMDGFEFLDVAEREFGSDFAKVVIVMLTTSLSPMNVDRAKTYDLIRAYFNKPLENSQLQWIADTVAAG